MRSTEIITLIASALAALVIYPQPAVSGGYAFDTATCSVDAIAFLRIEMQRTHMISVNSRNVVRASRIPSNVQQIINKMLQNLITDYEDPDEQDIVNGYVRDVFGGRQELGTGGTSSFVAEIPLRAARRHVTGNLIVYCSAARLAAGELPGEMPFTYDTETHTDYPGELPRCDESEGTVSYLVHWSEDGPDRLSLCPWFLNQYLDAYNEGRFWDTRLTVNSQRRIATGRTVVQWRAIRNSQIDAVSSQRSDIDLSIGFDMMLLEALAHTSQAGFKTSWNGRNSLGFVYLNAWSSVVNNRLSVDNDQAALVYMLIALGIFNYFSGWLLNVDTGNYDRLLPVRRGFDFGDDLVTFVEPQGTSK